MAAMKIAAKNTRVVPDVIMPPDCIVRSSPRVFPLQNSDEERRAAGKMCASVPHMALNYGKREYKDFPRPWCLITSMPAK
jgi:hypothetical protein